MIDSHKTNEGTSSEVTSRYANILLDYWFKRSFGTEMNKRLMILFLQETIPDAHVRDIAYSNKEHPNPFPDRHGAVIDVEAISDNGSRFVVEVQLTPQNYFMERALFYSSFAIQKQLESGQESFEFMPVYFIGLMDFSLHREDGEFLYRYILANHVTGETMTDRIQYIFLELPKVKAIDDGSSNLEKLCFALHNMTVLKSRPPEMTAEIFELLFNSAEIARFTPEEKVKYEYEMRTERDLINQLAYSHDKGLEEGREAALASTAKAMISDGLSVEKISLYTGLSSERIEALKVTP